jgi:hypothetical protein
VLTATLRSVYPNVMRDPLEPTNTLLVASRSRVGRENLLAAVPRVPADVGALLGATAGRLAPGLRGGRVYTDDLAPVEWLIDKSIVNYAASGEAD